MKKKSTLDVYSETVWWKGENFGMTHSDIQTHPLLSNAEWLHLSRYFSLKMYVYNDKVTASDI
jgi:hypothetical protein